MRISIKLQQLLNASFEIFVMVDGNSTLVNSMQPLKHPAGMILTESGMEIVLRLIQPLKAFSSIFLR